MEIPSPFLLAPDTGQLSLDGFQTSFGPQLSVSEFEKSDLFPLAIKLASEYPHYDPVFQMKSITLQDGRWAYLHTGFRESMLVRLGFGWGMVREYGFHELTVPEFREQLHGYSAWLESVLGPSLRCVSGQAYRQELPWGKIEASTDWRTELAGIGIRFIALPSRDFIEVGRTAYELGKSHGRNAHQYAARLATEALAEGQAEKAAFWQAVADDLKPRATLS